MTYEANIKKSGCGFLTMRSKTKITSVKTKEKISFVTSLLVHKPFFKICCFVFADINAFGNIPVKVN